MHLVEHKDVGAEADALSLVDANVVGYPAQHRATPT